MKNHKGGSVIEPRPFHIVGHSSPGLDYIFLFKSTDGNLHFTRALHVQKALFVKLRRLFINILF